ncbi:MAG: hypothetical protein ACYTEZ_10770 [Planctomycetota bacterium]|jgi:hypothetical protein
MEAEGWERRTVAQEPRLSEIVALYEELGFEVRLEPLDLDDPHCLEQRCTLCFDDPAVRAATKVVFTRTRKPS